MSDVVIIIFQRAAQMLTELSTEGENIELATVGFILKHLVRLQATLQQKFEKLLSPVNARKIADITSMQWPVVINESS